MMRSLYSLLMWLAQPLLRRKLARRAAAEPGYAYAMEERFGYYANTLGRNPAEAGAAQGPVVWVHAVSLGETRAAAVLVAQLRLALPGMRLLLTNGTATGREQGRALLHAGDVQVWQPWDTVGAVQRFLAHFRPQVGLLMETEIWPNLVAMCAQQQVPLCLVNARLSEKSLRQAQRLAWLARPAYRSLRSVWAQTEDDARRLAALGAPVQGVLGNLKFDAAPDAALLALGRQWRAALARPVAMLAVSREGEERLLLDALKLANAQRLAKVVAIAIESGAPTSPQWLIVPRHPQRFDEVAQLCADYGLRVSRRSQWSSGPLDADIWLGDSMQEMALYYGLADVALLGGSFAPLGGQNLIEAAACGCPVILGPSTFNFSQAADAALAQGAAFAEPDMAQALKQVEALLDQPALLQQARSAAERLSQAHRGAAQRTAAAVCAVLAR